MTRRLALLPLLLFALLFALACGDDADEEPARDSPLAAQSTGGVEVTATLSGSQAYPITVKDMLGRDVTIRSEPQRIVAASPSAIELLYAAGGKAVARSSTARTPAEVTSLTDIGSAENPALERIVAATPDLVLADSSLHERLATQFGNSLGGVPVVFVGAKKYDDVAASLRIVGRVINKPDRAESAAKAMEDAKTRARSIAAGKTAPRTLVLIGAANDSYAGLQNSFVGDLVATVNGRNIAAGEPENAPFPGYTKLSLERIVAANPEVILAATAGRPGGPTLADGIKGNAAYAGVDAVKSNRVHNLDVEVYLQAPGPRAADGLVRLAEMLYASSGGAASPTSSSGAPGY